MKACSLVAFHIHYTKFMMNHEEYFFSYPYAFILFIGANLKYKMVKTHSLYVFDKLLHA